MPSDIKPNIMIRDINSDDIERVHAFIFKEQGEAEFECDKRYIQALIEKGWLRIEGTVYFPNEEKKAVAAPKTDYLRWIVDSEGLHFGKIALLNGSIVGVILCYTQPENHKAFLSNMAVARHHRRKGIGSTLMSELIEFYKRRGDIETIELNVGLTNSAAIKFYLDQNFKIVEPRDTGHTMRYALKESAVSCILRPYLDKDFDDYTNTLLRTWPCEDLREARENVAMAVKRVKENEKEEIWVAEVEGKAVGFMLLGFTKVWGHKGEIFEEEAVGIDWFDVYPDFQRKGIGKDLLRKAEERGREHGLHSLFMHTSVKNLPMINFAAKNGFKFTKYLKEFWGKGTEDAFLLTKKL